MRPLRVPRDRHSPGWSLLAPQRRQLERPERIPHDRSSFVASPQRLLHPCPAAGRGAGRSGCSVDAADVHSLARGVVPGGVEHDLFGLDVRVVIRGSAPPSDPSRAFAARTCRSRIRRPEGLVRGRRQVEAAGARLEVVGVERVRPDVPVPADHVERVSVELVLLVRAADAQEQPSRPGLVGRLELSRPVEVPLRVRRVLEQLAVAVAVPVRRLELARRVEAEPELLDAIGAAPS